MIVGVKRIRGSQPALAIYAVENNGIMVVASENYGPKVSLSFK